MGYGIKIPNGMLSMCYSDFKCPKCSCLHTEKDYFERLDKSKKGLIYRDCKGCKTKLGISTNFMGDVVVWLKEEEK